MYVENEWLKYGVKVAHCQKLYQQMPLSSYAHVWCAGFFRRFKNTVSSLTVVSDCGDDYEKGLIYDCLFWVHEIFH